MPQSLTAVSTDGHVAIIGAVGDFDGALPFAIVQAKRLRLQNVTVGSRKGPLDMVRAIDVNWIKPVIAHRFALAELGAALRVNSGPGLSARSALSINPHSGYEQAYTACATRPRKADCCGVFLGPLHGTPRC